MVSTEICADSSNVGGITTYGGYLQNEIENISGASYTYGYVSDYVIL